MKIVKIKTWKQMEEEFGTDLLGDIKTEFFFTKGMEEDMPKNRIIKVYENDNWNGWHIDNDMIEETLENENC